MSVSLTVVNENVSLVISRQLLTDFCTHLPNLPDATAKAVYHFTLEKIQPRVISFEEQVNILTLLQCSTLFAVDHGLFKLHYYFENSQMMFSYILR